MSKNIKDTKNEEKVNHQLEIRKRKYYQSQFLGCGNDSAKMWKTNQYLNQFPSQKPLLSKQIY